MNEAIFDKLIGSASGGSKVRTRCRKTVLVVCYHAMPDTFLTIRCEFIQFNIRNTNFWFKEGITDHILKIPRIVIVTFLIPFWFWKPFELWFIDSMKYFRLLQKIYFFPHRSWFDKKVIFFKMNMKETSQWQMFCL